jgi:hypothetical protein
MANEKIRCVRAITMAIGTQRGQAATKKEKTEAHAETQMRN